MSKLAGLPTRTVVVTAPAGYGKSTAIAQWAALDRRPVAWLSLDARDNDPFLLLNYLYVALAAITRLPPEVRVAIASGGPSIWTSAVPRLGAALAAAGQLVLILDDFDRITDPDAADAILSLAGHIPSGSQFILLGRTSGRLPLTRLIADGRLAVVGVADLAFDSEETGAVLRAAGVDLVEADVEQVTAHLEGWPAGVYLTARSLQAGQPWRLTPVGRDLGRTSLGDGMSITDLASEYLRAELLERLDQEELEFALRTSVLDRLTGPLCDALLDRGDSAARLESWEQSNLFLVPLDGTHTWYRYHHLLHDVLAAELARRDSQAVRNLNMRAAAWHLEQGLQEQAFEYYAAADDAGEAARLLPGLMQTAFNAGRIDTSMRWADWFESTSEFDRHIEALVAGSMLFRHIGKSARADRWNDTAERWRPDPADSSAQRGDALRRLGRAFAMRSGPELMLEDARAAARGLDRADRWWPTASGLLGMAEVLSDRAADADLSLNEAIEESLASSTPAAIAAAMRAVVAIGRDDWATAERMVQTGQDWVEANNLGAHAAGITVEAVAARLAVHVGDRDAARAHIAHSQRTRPVLNHAVPWLAVRVRLDLAAAHLGLADPAGARTLLGEIRDIMVRRPHLGSLNTEVGALQARLEQIRGGSPSASTLTVAELRLLPLLSTHLSFKEIGERLFVSPNTVKSQAISIYRKLDATSRSEALERAAEAGLIDRAV